MQIKIEMDGAIVIMNLDGKLVAATAEEFKSTVTRLVERKFTKLLIDMKPLEFIDSSGLGALIAANKMLAGAGGRLVCSGLNEYVGKVFHITRADQKIVIAPSRLDGLGLLYTA